MKLEFSVKGSSEIPYEVVFVRDGKLLAGSCTCKAGSFGQLCKHRVSLLSGEDNYLDDSSEVQRVKEELLTILVGSDVEEELAELSKLTKERQEIDLVLKKHKKQLAKLLSRNF